MNYNFRLGTLRRTCSWSCFEEATQQSLSIAAVEERSEFDSVSAMADPEKSLVPELGILGVEIDPRIAAAAKGLQRSVRHHRRRARGRRVERSARFSRGTSSAA